MCLVTEMTESHRKLREILFAITAVNLLMSPELMQQ